MPVSVYKPIPIPPDYSAPDISVGMAMWYLSLSARSIQRMCESGALVSFRYGEVEARRITFESVRAVRERAIAAGPRLAEPPAAGRRGRGRPRKARADDDAHVAAE
jgi:hypothetical protein